ncbi:EI24 domain-containing protein [Cognatishimia sp. WU-CL00825]|uniref:EI24 domain-containing protein n=1 Tax=Cognatishimia sp. WU-CL00825 TaxID=3127658 RepID=UPI003106C675
MAVGLILNAFVKALGQLGDHRFRKVLITGIGLTLALLVGAYLLLLGVLDWFNVKETLAGFVGSSDGLGLVIGIGSFLVVLVLSIFLMVPVSSAFTSLFLEQVADAVEDRHYPGLPAATPVPLSEAIQDTLSFLGLLIVANIGALLLYLALPPLAPFIFWGLNGFLLGREYFTIAAMRRVGRLGAKDLRREHRVTIWAAGVLMAIPLTIPLVNLLVPVLGAATFTHIFHKLEQRKGFSAHLS